MAEPTELVNRFEFDRQVLRSSDPVLVAFYGNDDGSRKLSHKLPQLAQEYEGRVQLFEVNVFTAGLLSADFKVKPEHTPTVILFMGKRQLKRWGNEQNLQAYRNELDALLERIWA